MLLYKTTDTQSRTRGNDISVALAFRRYMRRLPAYCFTANLFYSSTKCTFWKNDLKYAIINIQISSTVIYYQIVCTTILCAIRLRDWQCRFVCTSITTNMWARNCTTMAMILGVIKNFQLHHNLNRPPL